MLIILTPCITLTTWSPGPPGLHGPPGPSGPPDSPGTLDHLNHLTSDHLNQSNPSVAQSSPVDSSTAQYRAQKKPAMPIYARESIIWGKNIRFGAKHPNYFGREFWYPSQKTTQLPQLYCFFGRTWHQMGQKGLCLAKNANFRSRIHLKGNYPQFYSKIRVVQDFWVTAKMKGETAIFLNKWQKSH